MNEANSMGPEPSISAIFEKRLTDGQSFIQKGVDPFKNLIIKNGLSSVSGEKGSLIHLNFVAIVMNRVVTWTSYRYVSLVSVGLTQR